MLIVQLGDEGQAEAGVEGRVVERVGPEGDTCGRNDADPLVLPPDTLAGGRIAQVEPAAAALEPETEPLAQSSAE